MGEHTRISESEGDTTPKQFRSELLKIMPGYAWTVHKSTSHRIMKATGTQSSGFNRLSTLVVERRSNYAATGTPWYEVKSAGFGLRAPFLAAYADRTLARALRGLQQLYEEKAATYAAHARSLQSARQPQKEAAHG
jgi:hypothetical protein